MAAISASTQLLSGCAGDLLSNPSDSHGAQSVELQRCHRARCLRHVAATNDKHSVVSPTFEFLRKINDLLVTTNLLYPLITDAALKSSARCAARCRPTSRPRPKPVLATSARRTYARAAPTTKDPNGAIDRMLYDLIADPELSKRSSCSVLVGVLGSADPDEKVAGWLHQVIGLLETIRRPITRSSTWSARCSGQQNATE